MLQLLIGITSLVIGIGMIVAGVPRGGKTVWFVGNPILEPMLPILIIVVCVIGVIEIAAYFTDIEMAALSGAARPRMR